MRRRTREQRAASAERHEDALRIPDRERPHGDRHRQEREADFKRVTAMFNALSDNSFRHGKVHTGAMLCGQAFPKNGVVEIAPRTGGSA